MSPSVTRDANQKYFAEVIYSTNEMVIAQCYKEIIQDRAFKESIFQGAIVKISSSDKSQDELFGVVSKINNSSLDNIHKPSALGLSLRELEELQPQVFELLRKELEIYLFAYKENGITILYPPKRPATIHDFILLPANEELIALTNDFSVFIDFIKRGQIKPAILANLVQLGYSLRNNDSNYLIKASKLISLSFIEEYDLLIQLLKRIAFLTKSKKLPD